MNAIVDVTLTAVTLRLEARDDFFEFISVALTHVYLREVRAEPFIRVYFCFVSRLILVSRCAHEHSINEMMCLAAEVLEGLPCSVPVRSLYHCAF